MRLHLIFPRVESTVTASPSRCPYKGCRGKQFRFRQTVTKPLRDVVYDEVTASRYQCLTFHRTFRVYPLEVRRAHTSQRVEGLAVTLYLSGLSYSEVSLVLEKVGAYLARSWVCNAARAVRRKLRLKRRKVFEGFEISATGIEEMRVRHHGAWLPLRVTLNRPEQSVLTVDVVSEQDIQSLREWLEPLARAVQANLLVGGANI